MAGAHWAPLAEPCPVIWSVHVVSPGVGLAVAGGSHVSDAGPEAPELGGVALATSDGGRRWAQVTAGVTPISARCPYPMIVQCAGR